MAADTAVVNAHDRRAARLADEFTELFSLITAATGDFLVKVREFDEEELWAGPGLMSFAHWLNWKCGIGMNAHGRRSGWHARYLHFPGSVLRSRPAK